MGCQTCWGKSATATRVSECGPRLRSLGNRHADRFNPSCCRCSTDTTYMDFAGEQSGESVRRRRKRQTVSAGRTRNPIRRALLGWEAQGREAVQFVSHQSKGRSPAVWGVISMLRPSSHCGRIDRCDRLPLGHQVPARAAHPIGPSHRMPARTRTIDRSKRT